MAVFTNFDKNWYRRSTLISDDICFRVWFYLVQFKVTFLKAHTYNF